MMLAWIRLICVVKNLNESHVCLWEECGVVDVFPELWSNLGLLAHFLHICQEDLVLGSQVGLWVHLHTNVLDTLYECVCCDFKYKERLVNEIGIISYKTCSKSVPHTSESLNTSFTLVPNPSRPNGRTLPATNLRTVDHLRNSVCNVHWADHTCEEHWPFVSWRRRGTPPPSSRTSTTSRPGLQYPGT